MDPRYPTIYNAEGPPIFAVYGMGLQGWSSSYEFQSSSGRGLAWLPAMNISYMAWDVDVPTQIGQFPILARMIARGDVRESPVISTRRVNLKELPAGQVRLQRHDRAAWRHQGVYRHDPGAGPGRRQAGRRVHQAPAADRPSLT